MSNSQDKYTRSRRLQKDENAVNRQLKIAKQHNPAGFESKVEKQPHRLSKHHAMNCGNPKCVLCGNPRKTFEELTIQEQRLFQDLDNPHNGLNSQDE